MKEIRLLPAVFDDMALAAVGWVGYRIATVKTVRPAGSPAEHLAGVPTDSSLDFAKDCRYITKEEHTLSLFPCARKSAKCSAAWSRILAPF